MIGRVFLYYTGYYNQTSLANFTLAQTLSYVDDVIKNSGHALVPLYASLWRVPTYSQLGDISMYAGKINPEVVWSIRYNITGESNQELGAGWWERMVGPRGTNIDPYGEGWGDCPVMPGLWNAYDPADTRRGATILNWAAEGKVYDYTGNQQAQYTGYNMKKYEIASVGGIPEDVAHGGTNWQFDAFEDYQVIRFADVLLMGAELYVMTNGANDATALNYTNQVRARAFGNATHNYTALARTDIFNERRLELACEGLRYWDILRSCQGNFSLLVPILTYADPSDNGVNYTNTYNTTSLSVDGNNFVTHKGLFQIPEAEIELMNGAIKQNPGY
jgi:hypothetical protein